MPALTLKFPSRIDQDRNPGVTGSSGYFRLALSEAAGQSSAVTRPTVPSRAAPQVGHGGKGNDLPQCERAERMGEVYSTDRALSSQVRRFGTNSRTRGSAFNAAKGAMCSSRHWRSLRRAVARSTASSYRRSGGGLRFLNLPSHSK